MDKLRRWWIEFWHPSVKCARVGHVMKDHERRAYIYPPLANWAVADVVWFKRPICERCGHAEAEQEISRHGLNGLTMDSDQWEKLRRGGRIDV